MRAWLPHAAMYARAGYHVFLCQPGAKQPFGGTRGLHDATRDAKVLTRWALERPDANIAVRTGLGMSVVDLDHGSDHWFEQAMADAGLDFGPIAYTPRGGLHVWFADPDGAVRNRAGKVDDTFALEGFDVRGKGGYVLVAPSQTADGSYGWTLDLPDIDALPPWPEAVVPADPHVAPPPVGRTTAPAPDASMPERRRAYLRAALEAEFARVSNAPVGTRNDTLNRAAFALARLDGLQYDKVADGLLAIAQGWGPAEHAKARTTIRSAFGARGVRA